MFVFLLKYYPDIHYGDFDLNKEQLETLKNEEIRRIWLAVDLLIRKSESHKTKNVRIFLTFQLYTAMALSQITDCIKGLQDDVNGKQQSQSKLESQLNNNKEKSPNQILQENRIENEDQPNLNNFQNLNFTPKEETDMLKREIENLKSTIKQIQMEQKPKIVNEENEKEKENIVAIPTPQPVPISNLPNQPQASNDLSKKQLARIKQFTLKIDELEDKMDKIVSDSSKKSKDIQQKMSTEFSKVIEQHQDLVSKVQEIEEKQANIPAQKLHHSNLSGHRPTSRDSKNSINTNVHTETINHIVDEIQGLKERVEDLELHLENSTKSLKDRTLIMEKRIDDLIGKESQDASVEQRLAIFMKEQKEHNEASLENFTNWSQLMEKKVNIVEEKFEFNFNKNKKGAAADIQDISQIVNYDDLQNLFTKLKGKMVVFEKDLKFFSEKNETIEEDIETLKQINNNKFVLEETDKKTTALVAYSGDDNNALSSTSGSRKEMLATQIKLEELNTRVNIIDGKTHDTKYELTKIAEKVESIDIVPMKTDFEERISIMENEQVTVKDRIAKLYYEAERNKLKEKSEGKIMGRSPLEQSSQLNVQQGASPMTKAELQQAIATEAKEIFEFVQEFVNEEAMNCIRIIDSKQKTPTQKMDAIDWILRNNEFISPKLYSNFVQRCYELYNKSSTSQSSFFFIEHTSDILISFKKLIEESTGSYQGQGAKELLNKYLEMLSIALFSQFNVEQAIKLGIHLDLIQIITDLKDDSAQENAQMCLSRMLYEKNIVLGCLKEVKFSRWVSHCLDKIPNNLRYYRSIFVLLQKLFKYLEASKIIIQYNQNLANQLIKILPNTVEEIDVLEENLVVKIKKIIFRQ